MSGANIVRYLNTCETWAVTANFSVWCGSFFSFITRNIERLIDNWDCIADSVTIAN